MPTLTDYAHFEGRHWETGSVANVLAYQRPRSDFPLNESMLLGLSGGAAFGYFVFDYKDSDPHVALLPRNTFDPFETILERLAVPQDLLRTASPEKAEANLIEILDSGRPAIVWADMFNLPYNALSPDEPMWAMMPIVVYGYEGDTVYIADRSSQPLTVSAEELAQARARVKKERFQVLGLGEPNIDRLPDAIERSIRQCISLYTDRPPRGSGKNFGFTAYEHLAEMLTNTRNKSSWARLLPPGRRMYSALAGFSYQPGAFGWARSYASNQVDDRQMYAKYLEQAAEILGKPELTGAAEQFRASSSAWLALARQMLPDDVPMLAETRRLLLKKRELFIEQGQAALPEIVEIRKRLADLQEQSETDFPLDEDGAAALRERIAAGVSELRIIEQKAIKRLQAALGIQ